MVFIASTSASFGRLGTGLSSSIARTIAPLLQANAKDVKEVTFFTPLALVLLTVGTNVLVTSLSADVNMPVLYRTTSTFGVDMPTVLPSVTGCFIRGKYLRGAVRPGPASEPEMKPALNRACPSMRVPLTDHVTLTPARSVKLPRRVQTSTILVSHAQPLA